MELTTQSIEKALSLTGKKMEDMEVDIGFCDEASCDFITNFSIEKLCYYLFSPEFIEKLVNTNFDKQIRESWEMGDYFPSEFKSYDEARLSDSCKRYYNDVVTSRIKSKTEYFGRAIYEYQKGNEQPLQDLLDKIP